MEIQVFLISALSNPQCRSLVSGSILRGNTFTSTKSRVKHNFCAGESINRLYIWQSLATFSLTRYNDTKTPSTLRSNKAGIAIAVGGGIAIWVAIGGAAYQIFKSMAPTSEPIVILTQPHRPSTDPSFPYAKKFGF
jgi:hypothetical protein